MTSALNSPGDAAGASVPRTPSDVATPAVELIGLHQRYPGVHALDNVDVTIRKGEVHALVGQNGAGKSTLIKILSGAERPVEGTVVVNGIRHEFRNPRDARAAGIGTIFQELSLVGSLTVAENVMLGDLPQAFGDPGPDRSAVPIISWRRMRQEAAQVLAKLGATIDVRRRVQTLTVAEQQLVELAKALRRDVTVVLLDEPTATLPDRDVEQLFAAMRRLRQRGVAMLYISHRLDEIYQIADRVTVMRDGRRIGTYTTDELPRAEIVHAMLGRPVEEAATRIAGSRSDDDADPGVGDAARRRLGSGDRSHPALVAADISDGGLLHGLSLTLHRGEVLGVGGLVGSGQTELVECLFGARRLVRGAIEVDGSQVKMASPRSAIRCGIGLLPAERKTQGLVLGMSVTKNTTIASMPRFTRAGIMRARPETSSTREMVRLLGMKVHSPWQPARTLSGGTQQKVVMAKWLVARSRILLFDEPTRGIDVGAKDEIYRLISDFVASGGSVLLTSSELAELLMCDRTIVMSKGRIVGELTHDQMDRHGERVVEMFA
jgi:ribose transport system ATP-binding protein